jgi:hypothetical protein
MHNKMSRDLLYIPSISPPPHMICLWMKSLSSFVFRKEKLPNDVSSYNHYSYLEDIYDLVSEAEGRCHVLQLYHVLFCDFPLCMYGII